MSYYNDKKNIEQYIDMAEGYDGKILIAALREYLPDESTVLELGMGPGKDLLLLGEHYTATGSDFSQLFLNRFRESHPDADLLQLNAVTMNTERKFDAIYSNKVLYHLTREQLVESLKQQATVMNLNGVALHSFWYGEDEDSMDGLHFEYYTEETLQACIGDEYEVLQITRYTEMEPDDSLYIVLKLRITS